MITRYFQRNVHRVEDIADLLQETFIGCFRSTTEVNEVKPFLFGIARHVLLRYFRKCKGMALHEDPNNEHLENEAASDLQDDPEYLQRLREDERLLMRAMRRLPLKYQAVFELSMWEEISSPKIAEMFGLTVPAVAGRLRLARAQLLLRAKELADSPDLLKKTTMLVEEWQQKVQEWLRKLSEQDDDEKK